MKLSTEGRGLFTFSDSSLSDAVESEVKDPSQSFDKKQPPVGTQSHFALCCFPG